MSFGVALDAIKCLFSLIDSSIWYFPLTAMVIRNNFKFCYNNYKTWLTTNSVQGDSLFAASTGLDGNVHTFQIVNQTKTSPLGTSLSVPLALFYFCSIDKCCVKQPQTIILRSIILMQLCTVKQTNITDLFFNIGKIFK